MAEDDRPLSLDDARAPFGAFRGAASVLLAVSGGPDSTALMHLAAAARRADPSLPPFRVATVDHGLQPASRAAAEAVAADALALGLPCALLAWGGPKPATRLQERAREARYALLLAEAGRVGASHLATAHTLDDQAETVLFRLARGSGVAGLAGMASASPRGGLVHLRPFLGVPKARLVAACRANAWRFAEDPANADPRFARARLRALMPALAAEGLGAARLSVLARRMAEAEAALGEAARSALAAARADGAERAAPILAAPAAVRVRALGLLLAGSEAAGAGRLDRLERLGEALAEAARRGAPLRRTLRDRVVDYDGADRLRVAPAPPRRRARGILAPRPFTWQPSADRLHSSSEQPGPSGDAASQAPPPPRPDTVKR